MVDSKCLNLLPHDVGSSLYRFDETCVDAVDFGSFKLARNQECIVDGQASPSGSLLEVAE